MDLSRALEFLFRAWPQGLPKAGIIVTAMDTIPFADFLIADEFVIVENATSQTRKGREAGCRAGCHYGSETDDDRRACDARWFHREERLPGDAGTGRNGSGARNRAQPEPLRRRRQCPVRP
ncbi:MAG: hypothetical protein R3B90_04925 [Planctomycetaceae bacterium]